MIILQQQDEAEPIAVLEEEWRRMFNSGVFKKEEMDKMVMELFISHGFADVAKSFEHESGQKAGVDLVKLKAQKMITDLIDAREIEKATNLIYCSSTTCCRGEYVERPRSR